jgi:hypothetical protein
VTLCHYLDEQTIEFTTDLENQGENVTLWKRLAEAGMTRIVLFNKRRRSKGSKLLCSSYENRQNWDKNHE